MRVVDILAKKRDGRALSADEIDFLVKGFASDRVPDYQMAAFLMAAYLKGMDEDETFTFTRSMVESGEIVDLSGIEGIKVDKHSTGGVGDKVTLILGPMMASIGLKVAKMSGRSLGHTGGTLDKLESIPGFKINLSKEQFIKQVNEIGIAVIGQTQELVPADKKIYALRDVTATVSSLPLIASSVMSKKVAGGADVIVLDVKAGSGAFMETVDDAKALAKELVLLGERFDKKAVAVVTNMDQPLGITIGNSLEVEEAIDTMRGFGSADLLELCFTLGAQLMVKAGVSDSTQEAIQRLSDVLESGQVLDKFRQFVEAQGGDTKVIDNPRSELPHARYIEEIEVVADGYIRSINAKEIGIAAKYLGAGRDKIEDKIDPGAGIVVPHKVGEYVRAGEVLAQMHSNDPHALSAVSGLVNDAFLLTDVPHESPDLIYDIIE